MFRKEHAEFHTAYKLQLEQRHVIVHQTYMNNMPGARHRVDRQLPRQNLSDRKSFEKSSLSVRVRFWLWG